ncbi:MAG: transporter substrate-binding domain-containing protein [Propionibacteriaceae bacterium]|nr:transporter substrate-binding domain-containing protein [Propionibacteriaceae bacterium]
MSTFSTRSAAAAVGLVLLLGGLSACGGDTPPTSAPPPATSAPVDTSAPPATSAAPDPNAVPLAENPQFAAGTTMARIAAAGKVKIGTPWTQPPFAVKNLTGEMEGYDVALARYIAGALGMTEDKIEWIEVTPIVREQYLQQGQVDFLLAAYAMNAGRQEVVGFAGPYLTLRQGFIVQKGNPNNIDATTDLDGKKICTALGSEQARQLPSFYPKAEIVTFDVVTKCVTAIENGQVDLYTAGVGTLAGNVSQNPDTLEMLPIVWGDPSGYSVGIQKQDIAFCEFLDVALQAAFDSGYAKAAWDKSFALMTDVPFPDFAIKPCAETAP